MALESWDDKFETLRASRALYHNQDYWEFLVRGVWRLDRRPPLRVVDFGCGFGWGGLMLLPLLPAGSTYTGLDTSGVLLERGRTLYADAPYPAEFVHADVQAAPFEDNTFDLAFAHTVLMHVPDPEKALREMIRVTRPGGMVITCDSSRNAFSALLHIAEVNEQEEAPLSLFQTMNRAIRRQCGVDYNLGARMPVLMHRAGLQDVGARMADAVRLLFPPFDTPEKEQSLAAACGEGLGYQPADEEEKWRWEERMVARGASRDDARREIERVLANDFAGRGRGYHTVWPGLLIFSYGTVSEGQPSARRGVPDSEPCD